MELTIFETEKKRLHIHGCFVSMLLWTAFQLILRSFFSLSFIPMQFLNNNSKYTVLRVTLHLLHKNPSILNIYDRLLWFRYWQMQTIGLKICLVSIKSRFVLHANRFWTFFRLSEKWKKIIITKNSITFFGYNRVKHHFSYWWFKNRISLLLSFVGSR